MCGIIAYTGCKKAKPILLDGLKRLEYRGYDSAGIAVIENGRIESKRVVGRVNNLARACRGILENSDCGIAHTRWATHGKVNETNAHPHFDCADNIAVVHNGIIENYAELKKMLENEGHKFRSETDTEVLAHLVEKFSHEGAENAIIRALKLVEGAYAIALMHKEEPGKIFAARKSSPLVIGVGKNEFFVDSDSLAIIPYTNKVIFLKDEEVAIITPKGYTIKNLDKTQVNEQITDLKLKIEEVHKGGFQNFMLKEIF